METIKSQIESIIQEAENIDILSGYDTEVVINLLYDLLGKIDSKIDTEKCYVEFINWVITNKRSVFLESDINKDSKKQILYNLNYSTNMLDD